LIAKSNVCRICGSNLVSVFDLGSLAAVVFPNNKADSVFSYPLCLAKCDSSKSDGVCGLVQLWESVDSDLLYKEYFYRSGINESMKSHLLEIANRVTQLVGGVSDGPVLDIGCNDGTLLRYYKSLGWSQLYGFDPAENVVGLADDVGANVVPDFFSSEIFFGESEKKAKVISSIAMFYDLENPNDFVRQIAESLAVGGVWVTEQSSLVHMLKMSSFDTMCHEHLEYYSLSVIERLLKTNQLEIVDLYDTDSNGGSMQLYVSHIGSVVRTTEAEGRINLFRKCEADFCVDSFEALVKFKDDVTRVCCELHRIVDGLVREGKRVFIYGASTKGLTIVLLANLSSLISGCSDRDSRKWGRYYSNTGISIMSEEDARKQNPDCFLVLPWHFVDGFIERESDYLKSGGSFLVPLPFPYMVNYEKSRVSG